jgi:chromosome segregation ATPase
VSSATAQTSSQNAAARQTEEQIEEYAQKVKDLRRALEDLRREKEHTDARAARADELEDQVKDLKRDNRSLEEKMAGLAKDPFIRGAFEQQESRLAYEDAVRDRDELKKKLAILQESVRTHYASLTALKQKAEELARDKEEAEKKAEELRLKYRQLDQNSELMKNQLRLYSGEVRVERGEGGLDAWFAFCARPLFLLAGRVRPFRTPIRPLHANLHPHLTLIPTPTTRTGWTWSRWNAPSRW